MTTVAHALETLFALKKVPVTKKELGDNLNVYVMDYNLNADHTTRLEIVLPNDLDRTDVQITYRYVTMLNRYEKRQDMLEALNEINESSSYYTFYLAQDGEVYARAFIRSGVDVQCLYESIVHGPAVIENVYSKIEAVAGVFKNA
ncbi:YbjN domain-containing protein [Carnobacteriaceae bacterium zg-C25]|nr:YbjN domain-containing protein [Carnobacteriaceae bacterium zg-ZUI240]QTU83341.1 YbjN domain-containing protein [Carnobacteriaceae bacterium zg-C25]